MNAQLKREQQELTKHLLGQDWNTFGTLKFVNGRTIGHDTAHLLLRSYWNKVDRIFFGRAAERQRVRVPRWCFAHEGSDSENFHVHFALLSPLADIQQACTFLNAVWTQHHSQTAGLEKNWIMPVQSRTAVVNYLTREYWRMGSVTVLDHISWSQTTAVQMADFVHDAQSKRITAAVDEDALRTAKDAFLVHLNKYKQIDDHL
jgi:hypothetical protein